MGIDVFDTIVDLLQGREAAKWPIWFPEWPIWRSEDNMQASQIEHLLSEIARPQYAVACESMFTTLLAVRELDSCSRERLPPNFDLYSASDDFRYWRDF
jgi:hypothetical protein